MYIPDFISKPVIVITNIFWSFSLSIVNRIAVEIFVTYHSFRSVKMSDEIKNLTEAVRLLHQLEYSNKPEHIHRDLATCLNSINLGTDQREYGSFAMNELAKELKIHRTSIQCLYRSVAANEHLTNLIWSYCKNPVSPGHKALQVKKPSFSSNVARKLPFD